MNNLLFFLRKKVLLLAFVALTQPSMAQVDSIEYESFNRALFEVWGHLDTSEINTGLLIDRFGYGESNTVYQNGTDNDSVTDYLNWLLFYNAIRLAGPDTNYQMKKDVELANFADSIMHAESAIPLGMMYYDYNKLKDSAIVDNLVFLEDNHKFMDNYNRTESPYDTKTILSICPNNILSGNLSCNFLLDTELFFSNYDSLFSKYEISYDNENTFIEIFQNLAFTKTFQDTGLHVLNFRLKNNRADTFYCKSSIRILDYTGGESRANCYVFPFISIGNSVIEPDFLGDVEYSNQLAEYPLLGKSIVKGKYARWNACEIQNLKPKPILFVAGFNPKNSKTLLCYNVDEYFQNNQYPENSDLIGAGLWRGTYYETYNGAFWPAFRGEPKNWSETMGNNGVNYLQTLREKGFDIWVLTMEDGMDRAENNACVIIQMIKEMNSYYLSNNQWEELIVSGYSAGAWASRYALTLMERAHNIHKNTPQEINYPHHRVRNWISFEGEFYGANTPIGFQHFVQIGATTMPSTTVGMANNLLFSKTKEILDSPAAQQLSRYVVGSGTLLNNEALQMRAHLNALNPNTRGYPEWCRKVALSQGSGVGINTTNPPNYQFPIAPSAPMFDFEEHKATLGFPIAPYREIQTWWNSNGNSLIAKWRAGFEIIIAGVPVADVSGSTETFEAGNFKGWDYCPGSTQATPNILFDNLLQFSVINPFSHLIYSHTQHSFAPTVGGFDIRTPASNYQNEESVFCDIDDQYKFYNIRLNPNNSLKLEDFKRYGYPYLSHPSDHKQITPFDAVCSVGDPTLYTTFLPNHFHVDDFQSDFLPFLIGEIAPDDVFVQNRDIGNTTNNYIAGFHAFGKVYCGQRVYQDFCDEWREKEGEVIIDQGTAIEMTGTEIHFRTGVSVTGGGFLHAKIESVGGCMQNMGGRFGETSSTGAGQMEQYSIEEKEKKILASQNGNFQVQIYPNPTMENNRIIIKLSGSESAVCEVTDIAGRLISKTQIEEGENPLMLTEVSKGIIIIKTTSHDAKTDFKKLLVD